MLLQAKDWNLSSVWVQVIWIVRISDWQTKKTRSEVLQGQQARAPELEQPSDVKPTSLESANAEVGDLNETTEMATKKGMELLQHAREGKLTAGEQGRIGEHAGNLKGAASYISNLHGQGIGTAEGKRSVLAGLGFNQSQLDALLSMANPDDAGNSLASLHGGQAALQTKQTALSSLGFSDSQVEALLSLANPDDEGNALASTHQAGSSPKGTLQSLGFSSAQADRFLALLNGQNPPGSAEHRALLSQMGYNDAEIDVMLSAADSKSLKQQDALLKTTSSADVDQMQQQSAAVSDIFSHGSAAADQVIEQLFDIFMVLELFHEMSVRSRRTARETRSLEYDAAKQEILNQADEMKKSAVHRLVAGVISGAAKVAAGAISGAGAFAGAKSKAPAGADATAQSQAQSAALQQSMQRATAVSQMVSGAGDMAAAGFNYQASMHDAKQKEHEAYQKTHDNAAQAWSEYMQLHQDMVKTVQSKMDEIIRTWYETLKSTYPGIIALKQRPALGLVLFS